MGDRATKNALFAEFAADGILEWKLAGLPIDSDVA